MVIRTKTLELRCKDKINDELLSKLKADFEFLKTLSHLSDDEANLFNELRSMIYEEEEKHAEKLKIMAKFILLKSAEFLAKFFQGMQTLSSS